MSSLRLGFHYHTPAMAKNGHIYMPGYFGRFVDSLGQHCAQVTCFLHTPRADEAMLLDYPLQSPNVKLVNIGPHSSVPQRMLFSRSFTRPLRTMRRNLDVMLLRGPSPLLPVMARTAGNVPLVLLLVGDYMAGINDLPQPRWRKEAIRLWSYWNQRQQICVAKRSLTFVNSRKLYRELQPYVPDLIETRTTTLNATDFFERIDTCTGPPYHLLYTGRMDRAKGLFEMVEALAILVKQGEDVVLDLVGWPEKGDPILEEIHQLACNRGVADRVVYHGFKPVGPELFAFYRQAGSAVERGIMAAFAIWSFSVMAQSAMRFVAISLILSLAFVAWHLKADPAEQDVVRQGDAEPVINH